MNGLFCQYLPVPFVMNHWKRRKYWIQNINDLNNGWRKQNYNAYVSWFRQCPPCTELNEVPCVANEARLHFKMNTAGYNSKFTSSHGDPHATSGLENLLGDVHFNLDTQRYWVKTENVWQVQSVGVSFVHPKSKGGRKYTWDRFDNKWKDHSHNPGKISEHPEGSSVGFWNLPQFSCPHSYLGKETVFPYFQWRQRANGKYLYSYSMKVASIIHREKYPINDGGWKWIHPKRNPW